MLQYLIRFKLLALLACCQLSPGTSFSQVHELIASGGDLVEHGYLLESSVGQPCVNNTWKGNHYLSEGFQQHYRIIIHKNEKDDIINIYPNPTNEVLHIESGFDLIKLNLYDVHGSIIMTIRNIDEPYYQLNLAGLAASKYFIELINSRGEISIQQIIKL